MTIGGQRPPWELTEAQAISVAERKDLASEYAAVSSDFFRPENDADYWQEVKRRLDDGSAQAVEMPDGAWTASLGGVTPSGTVKRHKEARVEEVRQLLRENRAISGLTAEQEAALRDRALNGLRAEIAKQDAQRRGV